MTTTKPSVKDDKCKSPKDLVLSPKSKGAEEENSATNNPSDSICVLTTSTVPSSNVMEDLLLLAPAHEFGNSLEDLKDGHRVAFVKRGSTFTLAVRDGKGVDSFSRVISPSTTATVHWLSQLYGLYYAWLLLEDSSVVTVCLGKNAEDRANLGVFTGLQSPSTWAEAVTAFNTSVKPRPPSILNKVSLQEAPERYRPLRRSARPRGSKLDQGAEHQPTKHIKPNKVTKKSKPLFSDAQLKRELRKQIQTLRLKRDVSWCSNEDIARFIKEQSVPNAHRRS